MQLKMSALRLEFDSESYILSSPSPEFIFVVVVSIFVIFKLRIFDFGFSFRICVILTPSIFDIINVD